MSSEFMRTWYWIWPHHVIPYHLYISILAYVSRDDVTHTLSLEVFVSHVMSLLELRWYLCMYWQALISVWSLNSFIFMTNRQNKKNGDRWRSALSQYLLSSSLSLVSLCSLLVYLFLSALIRIMSSLHNHKDLWKWCFSHSWTHRRCFKGLNITGPTHTPCHSKS